MLNLLRRWREYRKTWKAIRIAERAYDEYLERSGSDKNVKVNFLGDGFDETDRRLAVAYFKMLFVQCDGDTTKMMEQHQRFKIEEDNHTKGN